MSAPALRSPSGLKTEVPITTAPTTRPEERNCKTSVSFPRKFESAYVMDLAVSMTKRMVALLIHTGPDQRYKTHLLSPCSGSEESERDEGRSCKCLTRRQSTTGVNHSDIFPVSSFVMTACPLAAARAMQSVTRVVRSRSRLNAFALEPTVSRQYLSDFEIYLIPM